MKRCDFRSCLADHFDHFIALKQAGGRDYAGSTAILQHFDHYLDSRRVEPVEIDGALLGDYLVSKAQLAPKSRGNIVIVLWQALAYARRHGVPCPLLPERPRFPNRRAIRPHIYSSTEIDRLLRAALELPPETSLRPFTFSTLLGLLVTTGIRIGEALSLDRRDLDSELRLLLVRRGKFGKSRLLPLHPTACDALNCYRQQRQHRAALSETALFISRRGTRLSYGAAAGGFKSILRATGIRHADGGRPRLHDFRHTFAVQRVAAWYRAGVDVNQRLTALSTYLGHVDVRYTLRYLQPNEAMLREAAHRFETRCPLGGEAK